MCSNAHIKKRRKLPKGVGEHVRQSYKKSQDQKLLHLFLWQMSASLVKTFLSHFGQVYTKVLGKCLDSMWFCKVYFDLWLKFWQMEQVWASTPKSIYLFKSSGLDRPRNNNCLFLPSLTTGNWTTPVFWSEKIIDRQARPPPFYEKGLKLFRLCAKKKTGNPRLFTFSVLHSDLSLEGNELNGSVYHTFWFYHRGHDIYHKWRELYFTM